jgi:hypothetical protein
MHTFGEGMVEGAAGQIKDGQIFFFLLRGNK